MSALSLSDMQSYLSRSISSLNQNKLNGILAEIEFREYLRSIGFADKVSPGGWIIRSKGVGNFGHHTVALFPETITPDASYPAGRTLPDPSTGLHTICSTFHAIGIQSFFCAPEVRREHDSTSVAWKCKHLGLPTDQPFGEFTFAGFNERDRRYNFLRYGTDVSTIPHHAIPGQFTKENLRVSFASIYIAEISDIDGVFWGRQYTYPIEIKEKTAATDSGMGEYFGLDLGPFVKLAYYAAKKGNLHSIFVVKEIENTETRRIRNWWFIRYDQIAQYGSWVPSGGGTSMMGSASTVVKIPKSEFTLLNEDSLNSL